MTYRLYGRGVAPAGPIAGIAMQSGFSDAAAATGFALDALPSVTVAYSVRRLLTSYATNKAIQVRRASDNATLDVGFVGEDLDTASLATFLSATSGFITTWYDQSGSSLDLAQPTAANQPAIVQAESSMANRPCASFLTTSAQMLYRQTTPALSQPYTFGVVAERTAGFTTTSTIVNSISPGGGVAFASSANLINMFFGGGVPTASATDSVAHCIGAVVSGGTSKFSVDQAITSPGNPGTAALGGISVGQNFPTGTSLSGRIGELILFPSAVGNTDMTTLQANQKTYWGTP